MSVRLFGLVRPFDEANEDGRVCRGGVLPFEIGFENLTGPRAWPSNVDWDFLLNDLRERLGERRAADGEYGIRDDGSHQRHRFTEQKDLHVVPGFGERNAMTGARYLNP